ncbi:hypothetical protein GmHk_10G028574 [Glycine max]|nr:hypothetical protein GmHk_10G028574 [Glycine max]
MSCTLWESLALEFKDCFDRLYGSHSENRFLHNAQVKCFDELTQSKKECMCVTVVTISKLLVVNGLIYDGCPKCNKNGLSFVCVGCGNKSASTVAKFRVDVKVVQPNEFTILTLWDRKCYALIKETADEIKQKMIDEVVPGNTRHLMSQLSDDDELIKFVISKLPTL